MVLSELRQTEHLSASSIGTYVECSLLYKFSKIDKIPMEQKSDAMEFGSAIHGTLEEYYLEKMMGEILLLKDIHETFEKIWTRIAENKIDIGYSKDHDFKSMALMGKDLLTIWYNKLPSDSYRILGIEEAFSFYLPGIPIPFIGAIDLIEEDPSGTIIVTDHKTSARAYSIDEVDQNQQLTLYQMAVRDKGFRDREILLKFDTLIKTKTPKFEQYWTTRSELDEHRLIRKAVQVWDGISKQVFIPNDTSWKCKNCSYKTACNEWFNERSAA
ncbi:MAG: PD-(D/E)XK nuclease family protein [Desulfobacula sp.]|nr:PD-(D/E)XK nuclease family protein [Desulfobacula sp.]